MSDITVSKPDFERLYISRAEYNALRAELAQAKGEIARLQGIVDIRVDSESQYSGGELFPTLWESAPTEAAKEVEA